MNAKQTQLRLDDYIEHIQDAAKRLCGYLAGMSKEEFTQDRKTQDAVILNILVIGEAASQILQEYAEFARERSDIPWNQMKGMRNRMVHGYFETNLDLVWETVQVFIPELESKLQPVDPSID